MNYFFLLDMSVETCSKYFQFFKVLARIKAAVEFGLEIILPLVLIGIGIIFLIKAIVSKKDIKKAVKKLFKNIGLAVLIIIITVFVNLIIFPYQMCDLETRNGVQYEPNGCCFQQAYYHRMYNEKEEVYTSNVCNKNFDNVIIGKKIPKEVKLYPHEHFYHSTYYLKHTVWDGKVKYSKLYFHTPSDIFKPGIAGSFSLNGKYNSEFESNKDTAIKAFGYPNCKENKKSIYCKYDDVYVKAFKNGYVEAGDNKGRCYITKDGSSCCEFYN